MNQTLKLFLLLSLLARTLATNSIKNTLLYPYTVDDVAPEPPQHTGIASHEAKKSQISAEKETAPIHHLVVKREADTNHDPSLGEGSGMTAEPPGNSCISFEGSLYCASSLDDQFQYSWPQTLVGEEQNGRCFGNTAAATRRCQDACIWSRVNCSASCELLDLLQNLNKSGNLDEIIRDLQNITTEFTRKPEPLSEVYLLSQILFLALSNAREASPLFQLLFLDTASNLLNQQYREQSLLTLSENLRYQAGTLLLQTVNRFGLYGFSVMSRISRLLLAEYILMEVCNRSLNCGLLIGNRTESEVTVELNNDIDFNEVLIVVYSNLTGYLPKGRMNELDDLEIATSVVTVSVICENQSCALTPDGSPLISIAFPHDAFVENALTLNDTLSTVCAHWEIPERATPTGKEIPLVTGFWSHGNCQKNNKISNVTMTVCECTEAGTFAAVLSKQLEPSDGIILTWIYAFGASFSLFALVVTAGTFIGFRALWSMSSGIHFNLCVISSLVILSFAVRGELSNVTILCTLFAVFKHYFLLVQSIWLLLDGIVLLLLLSISKFKHKVRYYMLIFTILAYGIPLLYVCIICLPLGFLLWNREFWGYGDPTGCFVRIETNFYVSYIAPIVVVLSATVVVFGVVIVLERYSESDNTRRPSVSSLIVHTLLVLYFSLTWLTLPFTSHLYLVYLSTVLVSFQGVFIFILYVPCSRNARENIGHCLTQALIQCKHVFILKKFKDNKERPSSFVFEPGVIRSVVHPNPLAFEKEQEIKRTVSPQKMKTKSAMNPSGVSLWSTHKAFKIQPIMEELEEAVTEVTFL